VKNAQAKAKRVNWRPAKVTPEKLKRLKALNNRVRGSLPNFTAGGRLNEMKTEFCDNQFCENEAVKTVPVSVRQSGDSERKFCAACYEAYTIGVQHGRISENPKAFSRNSASRAGLRKSGKLR
jgi:hypothetical protein